MILLFPFLVWFVSFHVCKTIVYTSLNFNLYYQCNGWWAFFCKSLICIAKPKYTNTHTHKLRKVHSEISGRVGQNSFARKQFFFKYAIYNSNDLHALTNLLRTMYAALSTCDPGPNVNVWASSHYRGYVATRATDGNTGTWFHANTNDPEEWLMVSTTRDNCFMKTNVPCLGT